MTQFREKNCGRCKKNTVYNPWLTYHEKGIPICKGCIERRINPMRKALGQFPVPIHPESYGESNEQF